MGDHLQDTTLRQSAFRGAILDRPGGYCLRLAYKVGSIKEQQLQLQRWFQEWAHFLCLQRFSIYESIGLVSLEGEVLGRLEGPHSPWVKEDRPDEGLSATLQMAESRLYRSCLEQLAPVTVRMEIQKQANEGSGMILCALPVYNEMELAGIFTCTINQDITESTSIVTLEKWAMMFQTFCLYQAEQQAVSRLANSVEVLDRSLGKWDALFQTTQKMYAQIEVDAVITHTLNDVKAMFPKYSVQLFLSQDHANSNPHVKTLQFQDESDLRTRAFMDGELKQRRCDLGRDRYIYEVAAPLLGKQGVYGVIYLVGGETIYPDDLQMMSMLGDAAGTAFENAKLYEQSNLLINELRLINEITKSLTQSLSLKKIFSFACEELLEIFDASYCCISRIDEEDPGKFVVQASNFPAMFQEELSINSGFSGVVFSSKEPIIVSNYEKYSVKSKIMEMTGSRSLMVSPILIADNVVGIIHVVHQNPYYFSYENYKLLQTLSGHIGLAMANATLHAEVQRMVITDNLTGLYVRHYLDGQIKTMQKQDAIGTLILVDIDCFKQINDTFGHQVGDSILIQVSDIVRSMIREQDITARWGGEELAIYLPVTSKNEGMQMADEIRTAIMQKTSPSVTVSCGVADWKSTDDKISVESLFYKADMALYEAKRSGKNRVVQDGTLL
ncbi:GGDEF domain-containing protein [Paenibacillus larvae]|uniref:sensor domain-containing diguanylate cyclase n=1 Tax=Paenibacillus larvae TaxID=1464 RepID=UPI0022801876|nr:GGDEF domain-containing protein [Paenibacillus larvae]MCY9718243.1 GGDEF domain-containing protein [Paenibacillus larvae]